MRTIPLLGTALLPFAIAACSGSPTQSSTTASGKAAHHVFIVDVSSSPATMNDPTIAHAAEASIGSELKREAKLGDVIMVFESGNADAARMAGHPPIATGYNLRIPAAHAKLVGQLHEIAARFHAQGGDNATHLVQSLEAIHPDCSSGRDTVTILTDGLEEDGEMSSARELAAGKPVHLPTPPARYLAGCRKITFLGFGLTDDGAGKEQLLVPRQLAALRQGWLEYLTAAGVRPEDVSFISAF